MSETKETLDMESHTQEKPQPGKCTDTAHYWKASEPGTVTGVCVCGQIRMKDTRTIKSKWFQANGDAMAWTALIAGDPDYWGGRFERVEPQPNHREDGESK